MDTVYFQQDGALCHYALDVHTFLNLHFPGQWIGYAGPLTWAACSPDLTPMDFFAWGFIKRHVFTQHIPMFQELRNCIRQAAAAAVITLEMLWHVFRATANK